MSSARDETLARIRLANNRIRAADGSGARRLSQPRAASELVPLFAERVADYRATVRIVDAGGVADAIADAIPGSGSVVIPNGFPDAWRARITATVVTEHGPSAVLSPHELDDIDAVVTTADLGVAETGTLILSHGPGQGRRALTLVPDRHVCVISASQLVDDVPAAVTAVADQIRAGRPLTWISGPSATSDIELSRVEGVHGPRALVVVIVSDC
ncbi:LutC/YkgG family protein [Rudaeicoccus suwonensis]|uniref:L-lactate dehydrogenase complex protein LldG n=1 Tax=Rudaeicoccus suwonensis TaxID=657409 RepID=A0A561ECP0_9MICO|nr:LUD domain-containing protein [Rudaeicoccus suwonensis]TWE13381.1 L-lactate dehydrogenase complex protein LldG [Rudaeicoccus suwonensis]